MWTMGTNGFFGCRTRETPVAKKGFPAISPGAGGRTSSPDAGGTAPGGAAGKLGPCTAEKLQPAFSNSSPRSSLISPPPPPGRCQAVRRNVAPDPSSSWSRATMRFRSSRNRCSTSSRKPCMRHSYHPRRVFSERLLLSADRRADFGSEVLLFLLQALAQGVPREAAHLHVLADDGADRVGLVLYRALPFRVAEEGLLEQAVLLVELLDLPGDDLVEHRLGLALLAKLRAVNALLLIELRRGHLFAAQPPRIAPGDLHRDVLHQRLELLVAGSEVGLAVHLDEHADLSAQVDVGTDRAFGRAPPRLLPGGGEALLAQPGDRLVDVARRFGQRLLAIHHPRAGLLAQVLHHRRSHFCHCDLLLRLRFTVRRRLAAAQGRLVLHDRSRRRLGVGAHHRAAIASAPSARTAATSVAPSAALGCVVAVLAFLPLGLRLAGVVRLVARLALDGRVRDLGAEEPDGADGVVVAGDDVVDALGIAVRVDQRDDGNAEARRLVDGDMLLLRIDHEETTRKPRHLLDAAQVLLQLLHLVLEQGDFLLGQLLEGAVGGHLLRRLEPVDAALDGLEVGERAAQPPVHHVELAGPRRFLDHGVLRLLLGADEEDGAAAGADVADELERLAGQLHRLLQIDDVDTVAGAEDVRLHLRIPALGLVPEVDAGLEQLTHGDALRGLHRLLHAGGVGADRNGRCGCGCARLYCLCHHRFFLHPRRAKAGPCGNPALIGRCAYLWCGTAGPIRKDPRKGAAI